MTQAKDHTTEIHRGGARVELLEPFLALMPDAAVVVDSQGRIVSANERAAELFGYQADDLVDRPVEALIPERLRAGHRHHRVDYGQTPRARPMGATLELFGRRRDGSEFPVDISLAPVSGADGPLVVAAIRDATERRAATSAQAQLAAIVQSSTDAVVSMTLDGRISSWNPGAQRIFGYAGDEIVGRHISVLVDDDMSVELDDLMAMAIAGEPATPLDTRWRRRDGTRVDVALTVSPLRDPAGQPLGFSAILRDITERKAVEHELHRVLAEEHRRERQQAATAEIRLALLSGAQPDEALGLIARQACDLLEAEAAMVVRGPVGALRVVAAAGIADHLVGTTLADPNSLAGRVVDSGKGQSVLDLTGDPDLDPAGSGAGRIGPALGSPMMTDLAVNGALLVFRAEGRPAFSSQDEQLADVLSSQAALSVTLGRARHDRERLLLAEDRERIARDLHDLVIQRLFASGMRLEALLRLTTDPHVIERVDKTVEELDDTIRDIRSTIFALESPTNAPGIRTGLLALIGEAAETLGFAPSFRFDGPVDAGVPDEAAPHLLAVVREALSNVARHAQASHVHIQLSIGDEIELTVDDDGAGVGSPTRRSGLANLRQRAAGLGGDLELTNRPEGGTRLRWRVPATP